MDSRRATSLPCTHAATATSGALRSLLLLPFCAALLCSFAAASPATGSQQDAATKRPKNLILMIADGFGPAGRTLARQFSGKLLTMDSLLIGSASTRSTDSFVTDSAAGATAYASGVQTYNGAIGVDKDGAPVATLLEAAEARGMLTGLISTARMSHATPASFAAHAASRNLEALIAAQELAHGIELMLGGGKLHFLPRNEGGARLDGRDLMIEALDLGYQVLENRFEFDDELSLPLLGLFTTSHMSFEIDRDPELEPSLREMTSKAIELLSKDSEQGFFLMVEGGRIDHAGHANDPAGHVHDILAYDDALAAALEFAREDGETLLLSVADHETGGLTLGRNENNQGIYNWRPEYLKQVEASIEAIMREALATGDLREVLRKSAKVTNLTEKEEALLAELKSLSGKAYELRAYQISSILISQRALTGWSTWGHTAVDIEIFGMGPGSEAFRGHRKNYEVGRLLAVQMGFDLSATKPVLESTPAAAK